MAREGLEVADVFRHFGPAFRDQHGASLSSAQLHAMTAIEDCRTAALQAGTRSGTRGAGTLSASSGLAVAQTLLVAIIRYRAVVPRFR